MNFQRAATVVGLSEDRAWNGIASIELTPGGRLYCVSYTGGPKEPHPDNRVILCWSDDGGDSWTVPMTLGERSRTEACLDPCIWQDPLGRLALDGDYDVVWECQVPMKYMSADYLYVICNVASERVAEYWDTFGKIPFNSERFGES